LNLSDKGEGSVVALPVYGEFLKKVMDNGTLGVTREDTFHRPAGAKDYDCWDGSITIDDVEAEANGDSLDGEVVEPEQPSDVIFEEADEFY
jgi:hypothetical protein